MVSTTIYSSPWKQKKKATSLFWISTFIGRWIAPSDTKSTGKPPIPTSTYTKNPISIQPTNTQSLVHRAKALCDKESLAPELTFLTNVFKQNGYSHQQIQ